jgi:hypothetical protein
MATRLEIYFLHFKRCAWASGLFRRITFFAAEVSACCKRFVSGRGSQGKTLEKQAFFYAIMARW